ncbi:MAG: FadR/GntR family transcriptional regulator [Desulfobacteraceae bacterium]
MPFLFRKAKQSRIFQDVVDQIQGAILDGRIKPGDKLPAERELGEIFQTSRGTLREALRVLEQKGLIEIRLGVGGGAIVKDPGGEQITESLDILIRSQKISLRHLAEFREDVEGTVTGMAAERATDDDIRHLQDLLKAAKANWELGSEQWTEFMRVDEQVHMFMARISGNPIYEYILRTVHDNIHIYYDRYLPWGPKELNENYDDLCQLVAAVADKDAERAVRVAREHVRRFNSYMEKKKRNINTR